MNTDGYYHGEGEGESNVDDGVQKVIDLFTQNGNLEQYCGAVRKQQISLDVLLSMTKEEIKETLDIQVFGHLRELELLLEKKFPGKSSYGGKKQEQKQEIGLGRLNIGGYNANYNANPLVQNALVNPLVQNAMVVSNNILGGSGTPMEVNDLGGGKFSVSSSNPLAWMGILFFCIGAFIMIIMAVAMGEILASVAFVLITPGIFVIMGLIFSKCGMATRKWYSTFDDNTRMITIKEMPILPCCMSAPRKEKYDDISAVNVIRTNMAVNRTPVKKVQLNFKNGIKPAVLCTTQQWFDNGSWKKWIGERIEPK